jgi:hypothetical protein
MEEEKFISFRVPIELAEQAKKRAKSQHRSLQGHMLNLIENDLRLSGQGNHSQGNAASPERATAAIYIPEDHSAGGSSTRSTGRSRGNG